MTKKMKNRTTTGSTARLAELYTGSMLAPINNNNNI